MQADHDRTLVRSFHLDREILQEHVERRLAGAVAVPSTQSIVGNGCDPGRQRAKERAPIARQQRQHMLGDKRRSDRIDAKRFFHGLCAELAERSLGPGPVGKCQNTGCDQHHVGRIFGHLLRHSSNRVLVSQVEPEPPKPTVDRPARATARPDIRAAICQSRRKCVPDATTRAKDRGPAHCLFCRHDICSDHCPAKRFPASLYGNWRASSSNCACARPCTVRHKR